MIEHQPERMRFVSINSQQQSRLEYQLLPRHAIDFNYTFVPQTQRGQGIAEKLVRTALAWAREQGFEIQASCSYVRKFLR